MSSISDELPLDTRKALGKLLSACGLDNEFTGGTSPTPRVSCSRRDAHVHAS